MPTQVDVSLTFNPNVAMWLYTALALAREFGPTDDTYFLWKLYREALQGSTVKIWAWGCP